MNLSVTEERKDKAEKYLDGLRRPTGTRISKLKDLSPPKPSQNSYYPLKGTRRVSSLGPYQPQGEKLPEILIFLSTQGYLYCLL
ncbi:hypothetical protein AFLA_000723 [Aspergillus flavus NRRL3357]|nr:hypothetical protein AFLA_000723 [Aspergillus flavus NRRL3357]